MAIFKRTVTLLVALALAACTPSAKHSPETAALAAKVTELEAKVADLSDRQQIHEMYLRYMRGFDRNDVELMGSAFWPDVQINYGKQSNTFEEFVARHLNQHTKDLASWGHLLTNETVDISGDVAHVETYVTALFSPRQDQSFFKATIVGGRYLDRLDRRHGEWRIAVREFIPHFTAQTTSPLNFESTKQAASGCGMGTWDRRDPSYLRPLVPRRPEQLAPACAE